jgi:hypothetical protein
VDLVEDLKLDGPRRLQLFLAEAAHAIATGKATEENKVRKLKHAKTAHTNSTL